MGKETLRACSICKLVIMPDGKMIPQTSVNQSVYDLSHGILSRECFNSYYDDVIRTRVYRQLPNKCEMGKQYVMKEVGEENKTESGL